uniref:Uncharacterized protein n=1 Tax=Schistocephalus solidus TaxID=70667 RepID=A0A0X3NXG8_SCHSO
MRLTGQKQSVACLRGSLMSAEGVLTCGLIYAYHKNHSRFKAKRTSECSFGFSLVVLFNALAGHTAHLNQSTGCLGSITVFSLVLKIKSKDIRVTYFRGQDKVEWTSSAIGCGRRLVILSRLSLRSLAVTLLEERLGGFCCRLV